jgi:hypothetical protein
MNGVPLSYLIDRDGKVVNAWYGFGEQEGESRVIAALQKMGGRLAEAVRQDMDSRAAKAAPEVAAAAKRLFEAIRAADYDHDWTSGDDWKRFPAKDVDYNVERNAPGWMRWVCKKFKANSIVDVQLGKVFAGADGSPTVPYELRLKDGDVLRGDLPFQWDSERKQWIGWEGLDWHLRKNP